MNVTGFITLVVFINVLFVGSVFASDKPLPLKQVHGAVDINEILHDAAVNPVRIDTKYGKPALIKDDFVRYDNVRVMFKVKQVQRTSDKVYIFPFVPDFHTQIASISVLNPDSAPVAYLDEGMMVAADCGWMGVSHERNESHVLVQYENCKIVTK